MERGGLITHPLQLSHRLLLGSLIDPRQEDPKPYGSNYIYKQLLA